MNCKFSFLDIIRSTLLSRANFSYCFISDKSPTTVTSTIQNMKFSIKDFFSKRDQIRSFLWILSHLLKKSLIENFIFCAVLKGKCQCQHISLAGQRYI